MKFREVSGSDVVLGLGPWLSLRTKSQSLVLALALTRLESLVLVLSLALVFGVVLGLGPWFCEHVWPWVKSLVLALALKVQSLPRTTPKTKAKDNTTEIITYLIL